MGNKVDVSRFSGSLEGIIESAGIGLWDWHMPSGKVIYSKQFENILGYGEGEFPGTLESWRATVLAEDLESAKVAGTRCINGETSVCEVELRVKKKDGGIIWTQVKGAITERDDEGNPIKMSGVLLDIDSLKNLSAKEDLEEALAKARDASRAKDEFLSKMSHELRTPLNAIIGMLNIAGKTDEIEKIRLSLDKMMSASKNLLHIINDILDISKMEAGKMELVPAKMNIEHMFKNIINIVEFSAYEKDINIKIDVPVEDDKNYFIGDEKRLTQVFMNLLSNALKFTSNGGSVTVKVSYNDLPDDRCEIISEVTDTGVGIPADKINSLFNSFVQIDNRLSRQYTGTGLGLVIAKNIVELMGGGLSVESVVGEGTTFRFNVILEKTDAPANITVSPDIFNILVIDDSEDTCEYLSDLFDARGIRHQAVMSGSRGIELVKDAIDEDDSFNIILVDYYMDEMNGIDVAAELRHIVPPETIIIMISSIDWAEIEDEAKTVGVNTFLAKPLLPSNVINAINEIYTVKSANLVRDAVETYDFSGCNILLFEDVEINREIVRFLLEDTGAVCTECEDGEIGLQVYNADPEKYDLILMDIQMPNMDGFEATKLIRESGSKNAATIPIVAMTANVFANQIRDMIGAGMNSHLGKPIDELEMKRELSKYLRRKR